MKDDVRIRFADHAGEFLCQSKAMVAEKIKNSAEVPYDDLWLSFDEPYPCLAILVNGQTQLACVHYFADDRGNMWQSVGDIVAEDVAFATSGEAPMLMPADCVITLQQAIACAEDFCDAGGQRPKVIAWREL